MNTLIAYFAVIVFITGVINLVNPSILLDYVRQLADKPGMQVVSVGVRLILGIALILVADDSKFPVVILFIGLMALAAAVIFTVIGRENFAQLMTRLTRMSSGLARFGGAMSILLAGFLVYAVL